MYPLLATKQIDLPESIPPTPAVRHSLSMETWWTSIKPDKCAVLLTRCRYPIHILQTLWPDWGKESGPYLCLAVRHVVVTPFHHTYTSHMDTQKDQPTTSQTSPLGREHNQSPLSHQSPPSKGSGCLKKPETESSKSMWPPAHARKERIKRHYSLPSGWRWVFLIFLCCCQLMVLTDSTTLKCELRGRHIWGIRACIYMHRPFMFIVWVHNFTCSSTVRN